MDNPYTPPSADVRDRESDAITLSGSRLLRTYHRILIVSSLAFIAGAVLLYLPIPWPEDTLRLRLHDAEGSLFGEAYGALWLLLLLLGLIARVGMYFLERWARTLFVSVMAVGVAITLFHGMIVLTPIEGVIGAIGGFADGALLVLAFTNPLRRAFTNTEV